MIQSATQAKLALLVSAAVYGLSYVVSKDLQDHKEFGIQPGVLNGIRFFLASSLFFSDLLQSMSTLLSERLFPKRNTRILRNDHSSLLLRDQQQRALIAGLELGLWASLGFLSQSLALQSSSASKVSFFSGLTVVVTPLIAYIETVWLTIKRILFSGNGNAAVTVTGAADSDSSVVSPSFLASLSSWVAPCLAVAGAAVLELGDAHAQSSSTASSSGLSNIYLVLTPLAFGIWFHRSEALAAAAKTAAAAMQRSPERSNSSSSGSVYTRVVTGSMLLIAALVSYIYSYCMECDGGRTSPGLWMLFQSRKVAIPMVMFIGLVATGWTALVEQLVGSFNITMIAIITSNRKQVVHGSSVFFYKRNNY